MAEHFLHIPAPFGDPCECSEASTPQKMEGRGWVHLHICLEGARLSVSEQHIRQRAQVRGHSGADHHRHIILIQLQPPPCVLQTLKHLPGRQVVQGGF